MHYCTQYSDMETELESGVSTCDRGESEGRETCHGYMVINHEVELQREQDSKQGRETVREGWEEAVNYPGREEMGEGGKER